MSHLHHTLESLCKRGIEHHLGRLGRGLEKESLRIDGGGILAQTPHPSALGAALTHPAITTDYSEALLEFVTPVHTEVDALLQELSDIHHFTYHQLRDEKLWVASMPCIVEGEQHIPIARYGDSNIARMKEIYRHGLRLRYGSLMQTIAGIHFNFSMPQAFWGEFLDTQDAAAVQAGQSAHYFALIRNFHRHAWLSCYLFGASPAVCKCFLEGRSHALELYDPTSFYAPAATSLRLSGLGYSSHAQADIEVDYNGVAEFVASLQRAINTPHPRYAALGIKGDDGAWRQLNANLLQIENEFYSVIRPKRVTASGESPSRALAARGVEYVEVRSVDLDPFLPIGINAECVHFFDMLLLYCLFTDSPPIGRREWECTAENRRRVVMRGRDPGLTLCGAYDPVAPRGGGFAARARALLDAMRPLAELLDQVNGGTRYGAAWEAQRAKIDDPGLTPSARILESMAQRDLSFYEFAMELAEQHEADFKARPLAPALRAAMEAAAQQSHTRRAQMEAADQGGFDAFLADYVRRQNAA